MAETDPAPVTVRYPEERDINVLASLFSDARADTEVFHKRHQLLYREIALSKSPSKFFLVVEYHGKAAGFIRMVRSKNPFSRTWWIAGLEVDPDLARRGLGTRLVKEALYNVYHRGGTKVFLAVDKDNVPAVKFYDSLRFRKARGLSAWITACLHPEKKVLMLDLAADRGWLERPAEGFKYMGIK